MPNCPHSSGRVWPPTPRRAAEKGWTVTLQAPSYVPFMTYSSNRALKEKLWRAYNSRALGGENDNTQIVKQIATCA